MSKKINYPDIRKVRTVREDTLRCGHCGYWLPDTMFYRKKQPATIRYRRGRSYTCKNCENARSRANYAENIDYYHEYARQYRRDHPEAGKNRPPRQDKRGYRRDQRLRDMYGITLADFNQLVADQGGVCAICGLPETMVRKGKLLPLAVDHCHDTTHVRGLLCHECNNGIGKLKDNPHLLRRAADYLEKHLPTAGLSPVIPEWGGEG